MDPIKPYYKLFGYEGLIFIGLGLLAILIPALSTQTIEILIGVLFIFAGLVQGGRTARSPFAPGQSWNYLTAALYFIVGVLFLTFPQGGEKTLTAMLITFFIINGLANCFLGFRLIRYRFGWARIFTGFISLFLADLIWIGWPDTAAWAVGLIVGVNLLVHGIVQATFAFTASRSK